MSTYNRNLLKITKCPYCNLETSKVVQTSGNTFGAVIWSDGFFFAPCWSRRYPLRKCCNCKRYFHVGEAVSFIRRQPPIVFDLPRFSPRCKSQAKKCPELLERQNLEHADSNLDATVPNVDKAEHQDSEYGRDGTFAPEKLDSDLWKKHEKPMPPGVLKLEDIYPKDNFPSPTWDAHPYLGFEDVVKAIRQYDLLKVTVTRAHTFDLRLMLVERYNNMFREWLGIVAELGTDSAPAGVECPSGTIHENGRCGKSRFARCKGGGPSSLEGRFASH